MRNCNRGTALQWSVEKLLGVRECVYLGVGVGWDVTRFYRQMFGRHRNTYKHCEETKQMTQWRYTARTKENHKQGHDGPSKASIHAHSKICFFR